MLRGLQDQLPAQFVRVRTSVIERHISCSRYIILGDQFPAAETVRRPTDCHRLGRDRSGCETETKFPMAQMTARRRQSGAGQMVAGISFHKLSRYVRGGEDVRCYSP